MALEGDINADMAQQLVTISDMALTAKANNEQQTIDAKLTGKINSNLGSQQTTIDGLNLTADITDPSLPGEQAQLELTTNVSANLEQQTVTLTALRLSLQELLMEADIKANNILSDNPGLPVVSIFSHLTCGNWQMI